jgi:hypothetical protein
VDDDERGAESSRSGTAEFRLPKKDDLTRPDIPVRRKPKEPAEEPASPSTWYVEFSKPEDEAAPETTKAKARHAPEHHAA